MLTTLESARIIEGIMVLPCILMGLSHIVRPTLWQSFFTHLHSMGEKGVIYRTFSLELVPAIAIVTFHQVWHGWGTIVTLYGIALSTKITLSLLFPSIGLRSLAMANTHSRSKFLTAGGILIALGFLCAWLSIQGEF
ncbi:MAG: hypothetical protein AAGD25_31145 [Cyanobacteria bacterium P01_F01_bin.150]